MNDHPPDPRRIVERLLSAAHTVERRLEQEVGEASGLSLAQLDFLEHLERAEGSLPLGKVAEGLCCVRSNVTQLADRLECQGWIRRENVPDDRRLVQAVLTEEGRARYEKGAAARLKVVEEIADAGHTADLEPALARLQSRLESAAS